MEKQTYNQKYENQLCPTYRHLRNRITRSRHCWGETFSKAVEGIRKSLLFFFITLFMVSIMCRRNSHT